MAVTTSIGPGATNMVTGAALATTNRIPVLLFPSDQFANRVPDPVLQQLEDPGTLDVTVNDVFRPVSRFFDRISRPEQLIPSLMNAMRVLTDPADTGAVTVCLPQDVQAEAHDWPLAFFAKRVGTSAARCPSRPRWSARWPSSGRRSDRSSSRAAAWSTPRRPRSCAPSRRHGDPRVGHPCRQGRDQLGPPVRRRRRGSTGSSAANALAREADVVIGIGTRYSDFTTASHTIFANEDVRFVNVNVLGFDAAKHGATMLVADAREALIALTAGLEGWQVDDSYRQEAVDLDAAWQQVVDECYHRDHTPLPAQTEVFGALNELMGPKDVVINAAGSMPGDLQCLWRASTPEQYHVEYAFSCMGYEIPASLGVKLAVGDDQQVVAIVGDGTYQMLPMEIATIVSEGVKVIIVLLQNHGFASIGALSESRGSQRFGTKYRMRQPSTGRLDGEEVPFDLAANAASWGADVLRCGSMAEFRENYGVAAASDHTTVLYIETDLLGPNPPGSAWWDVPVSQVSALESTQQAFAEHLENQRGQRAYL